MQCLPHFNYITCNNTHEDYRMFYTSWGKQEDSQKTLLCIHGLGRNGRDWGYVGMHFAKKGYYVVAPDIVGHGNSDYLTNPSWYSLASCELDLLSLIKK